MKVRIKHFHKQPRHWDDMGFMAKCMGNISEVKAVLHGRNHVELVTPPEYAWSWTDLEVVEHDPFNEREALWMDAYIKYRNQEITRED